MGRWIAYEHAGPEWTATDAYALITADTKEEAKALMGMAFKFNRDAPSAERRNAIDLDGIDELPEGDPKDRPAPDDLHGLVYVGFDEPSPD